MSHSDSEINRNTGPARNKLHSIFKPKSTRTLSSFLRTIPKDRLAEHLKQLRANRRMLEAVSQNNTEVLRETLDAGTNPNHVDTEGRTALHIAASRGYLDAVNILLEYGGNPNKCDRLDNTPLHLAACTHHLSVVCALLKAGADVQRKDIYGKTPLHLAESKWQLIRRSYSDQCLQMNNFRRDMQMIVELLLRVYVCRSFDFEMMRDTLECAPSEVLEDRMTTLLSDLEKVQIS